MPKPKYNFLLVIFLWGICLNVSATDPPKSYFQQRTDYLITVQLDDNNHSLYGQLAVVYTNNSPDTLSLLWFHLWPNAYKNSTTGLGKQKLLLRNTDFYFLNDSARGYMDSLDFSANGEKLVWKQDSVYIDICSVLLPKPLLPGDSILIETPFRVFLPDAGISRLGHAGQAYYITQWFPKPAVYDREGWHAFPYLDMGEFYSEFGSFDVSITLPKNYVVAATGRLQNEDERIWLLSMAASSKLHRNSLINLKDYEVPVSSTEFKTLRYVQDSIHDFAWFADKSFKVMMDEVTLPSGKKTEAWAFFTPAQAGLWKEATLYVNKALVFYSEHAGEYPYEHATAVEGVLGAGGGMEYPMITMIGESGSLMGLETVIMHEVGHNWFMGMLGFNEREHPWLDEGINSFYEFLYMQKYFLNSASYIAGMEIITGEVPFAQRAEREMAYMYQKRYNKSQPMEVTSDSCSPINYIGVIYEKSAFVFDYLRHYLGNQLFDSLMMDFNNTWRFKHPEPGDLAEVFMRDSLAKKTSWFFNDLVKTDKAIDYKIRSATFDPESKVVKIKLINKGKIPAPMQFAITRVDGSLSKEWIEGFRRKTVVEVGSPSFASATIDPDYLMPDVNRSNNYYRNSFLLPKTEPLKFRFFTGAEYAGKTILYWAPVPAWNGVDGFNPGVFLSNYSYLPKKFGFVLMPTYSFRQGMIGGMANMTYRIHPASGAIRHINVKVAAQSFGLGNISIPTRYYTVVPQVNMQFRNNNPQVPDKHTLSLRLHQITRDYEDYNMAAEMYQKKSRTLSIPEMVWEYNNNRVINPVKTIVSVQNAGEMLRASGEVNYFINYNAKKKGLKVRFFAGKIFNPPAAGDKYASENLTFKLSGNSPTDDPMFNNLYLARSSSNSWMCLQTDGSEGGFKVYTLLGKTWNWLSAVNLETTLPGKNPVKAFVDIGAYQHNNSPNPIEFQADA
ncbi:MAG: M1 family metallopeptidase, partial [Bacteroidetes bacterium]|nr:M1 family metallopeptidase [Bacteroidota bacterium]